MATLSPPQRNVKHNSNIRRRRSRRKKQAGADRRVALAAAFLGVRAPAPTDHRRRGWLALAAAIADRVHGAAPDDVALAADLVIDGVMAKSDALQFLRQQRRAGGGR